jgi:short-subunit dehydrogenase
MRRDSFADRYGPWALVAGASQGIGAAFASAITGNGVNVALVARRADRLEQFAAELAQASGVQTLPIALDLADPHALQGILKKLEGRDVGLLVYNAALSLVGPFLEQPLERHVRELDVNCRAPLTLVYELGQRMAHRGKGGIVLMSSLAGFQGSPFIANYAATKAYTIVLAESLWAELRPRGVDVLACCAGAVATPGYVRSAGGGTSRFAPQPLTPSQVALEALHALGNGKPTHIPGRTNRFASQLLRRALPRTTAIGLMGSNTRNLNRLRKS